MRAAFGCVQNPALRMQCVPAPTVYLSGVSVETLQWGTWAPGSSRLPASIDDRKTMTTWGPILKATAEACEEFVGLLAWRD